MLVYRGVTDIASLEKFIHLRYVDLTKNLIRDISPLNSLTQVSVVHSSCTLQCFHDGFNYVMSILRASKS